MVNIKDETQRNRQSVADMYNNVVYPQNVDKKPTMKPNPQE